MPHDYKKVGDIKRRAPDDKINRMSALEGPQSIAEGKGQTNGVDPYIENPQAPEGVPLGVNTEPFDLERFTGGTGK